MLRARNNGIVRQGCVLGMFLFCLTMEPIYARLWAAMGEEGALYTYRNDSYLIAETGKIAKVLADAPTIFGKVGLRQRCSSGLS